MSDINTKEYQSFVFDKLKTIFGEENVENEWDVGKDSSDDLTRGMYCPRPDLAIGPFNRDRRIEYNNQRIAQKLQDYGWFINRLIEMSENTTGNTQLFMDNRNKNPRCLIAIEIEKKASRKHMLGDIANASILGAIGLVIPLKQETLQAFMKIMNYIQYATAVGKLKPSFNNVLIIEKEKFSKIICEVKNE